MTQQLCTRCQLWTAPADLNSAGVCTACATNAATVAPTPSTDTDTADYTPQMDKYATQFSTAKPGDYSRFTDRARKVMQLANREAQRMNHEFVGTEHIAVGLIEEGSGVAANVLKNFGVDLPKIRAEAVKAYSPPGPDQSMPTGKSRLTPRAAKVIEYANEEARNLNHTWVGTEHLLLGMLRDQHGAGSRVLIEAGLKREDAIEEILHLMGAVPPKLGNSRSDEWLQKLGWVPSMVRAEPMEPMELVSIDWADGHVNVDSVELSELVRAEPGHIIAMPQGVEFKPLAPERPADVPAHANFIYVPGKLMSGAWLWLDDPSDPTTTHLVMTDDLKDTHEIRTLPTPWLMLKRADAARTLCPQGLRPDTLTAAESRELFAALQNGSARPGVKPQRITADAAPAPLPTDEQIASLLKENERLAEHMEYWQTKAEAYGKMAYDANQSLGCLEGERLRDTAVRVRAENERLKAELENAKRGLPKYWLAIESGSTRYEMGAETLRELQELREGRNPESL